MSRQEVAPAAAPPRVVVVHTHTHHTHSMPPPTGGFPQFPVPAPAPPRRFGGPGLAMLLPLGIVGIVMLATFHTQLQNLTGIGAWAGDEPLICDGNDQIDVSDVKATFAQGSAIVARGNCHVTLKNCAIKAAVAIDASGNAHVSVINGSIEGSSAAVDAKGNATVDILGNARTTGSVRRASNAHVTGK